jgi:hypothetical protein
MSPPQLGRGEEWEYAVGEGDSPVSAGLGEVEFVCPTDEIAGPAIKHIALQSKRQAEFFQQKLHSTGLQEKAFRAKTVPLQRGMRMETQAWKDLASVVNEKGAEEVKAALASREVPAVTSANVGPAVQFLARALEVKGLATTGGETPASTTRKPTDSPPPWDGSKTPEGRFRYLKRNKITNSSPMLKSPEKVGWDHDKYFRSAGGANPANCLGGHIRNDL